MKLTYNLIRYDEFSCLMEKGGKFSFGLEWKGVQDTFAKIPGKI